MTLTNISIIEAVVLLIVAATVFILGFAVNKMGKENLDDIFFYAKIVVAGIEQIAAKKGWTGKEKYWEAFNKVKKKFPNLTEQELQSYIESAVYWLNEGFKTVKEEYDKFEK